MNLCRITQILPERPEDAKFIQYYIAMTKLFYGRAMSYFNIPMSIISIFSFVMLAELRLDFKIGDVVGLPQATCYILIITLIPIVGLILGFLDWYFEFQQHENILTVHHFAPKANQVLQNTEKILSLLEGKQK